MVNMMKIPFLENGDLMLYAPSRSNLPASMEWKDNFEFYDTLEYQGMKDYRKTYTFKFVSVTDGKVYWMNISKMNDMMSNGPKMENKRISGRWTFSKVGYSSTIVYVGD